jgi:hypothetical protein
MSGFFFCFSILNRQESLGEEGTRSAIGEFFHPFQDFSLSCTNILGLIQSVDPTMNNCFGMASRNETQGPAALDKPHPTA